MKIYFILRFIYRFKVDKKSEYLLSKYNIILYAAVTRRKRKKAQILADDPDWQMSDISERDRSRIHARAEQIRQTRVALREATARRHMVGGWSHTRGGAKKTKKRMHKKKMKPKKSKKHNKSKKPMKKTKIKKVNKRIKN
ncbi:hypothetical protein N9O88_01355 [bacterium]|nr:hypothetical protein [bacterium]